MRFLFGIIKTVVLTLFCVALVAGSAFWYLANRAETARGTLEGKTRFTVSSGDGVVSLADRLSAEGIIDGKLTFIAYAIKTGIYKRFQVGVYSLSGTMTIPEITERIAEGRVVPAGVRVTFPEGWTLAEMAERLNENNLPGDDFLAIAEKPFPKWRERYAFLETLPAGMSLEGYLFPDTYIFPPAATGELVVNELLKNFGEKAAPVIAQDAASRNMTFHEVLTLASIIEEEGKTESDRKNISDVFRKRLDVGQALQSDATINYVLGTAKDQPTYEDLQANSPYNTYANVGLPPGPIGNPSLMSIDAALHPTPNPYYYFLINTTTRTTYFARDFAEHQRNRVEQGL